jgi:porin
MKFRPIALTMLASLMATSSAYALDNVQHSKTPEPAPSHATYDDKLLGDVGGARNKLANAGIEVSLDYQGDVWSVLDGGKKRRTTYLDFIELRTNLDGEKLFGIKGNTVSLSLIDSNGTTTNASTVGSTQGIDNSEVAVNGVRVYEAWMEQNFFDDHLSFLFGLHDLNTEFASTPVSDNFLTPTMQIGQSFAQSGANGPSVFPTTSLAGRVKVKPTDDSYVAVAAYDGIPGNPNRTTGDAVHFGKKDGLLLVGEAGFTPKATGSEAALNKLALGVWKYTSARDDLSDVDLNGDPVKRTAQGVYALSSARIYYDVKAERSLSAFLRGGVADGDTAQVDYDVEAGLVATGFVPSRPEGELGLGVSRAHNGDAYITSVAGVSERNETSFELYYRDVLCRGVTLQPDMQYVVNPGTDTVTDDAFIVGARLGVSF